MSVNTLDPGHNFYEWVVERGIPNPVSGFVAADRLPVSAFSDGSSVTGLVLSYGDNPLSDSGINGCDCVFCGRHGRTCLFSILLLIQAHVNE